MGGNGFRLDTLWEGMGTRLGSPNRIVLKLEETYSVPFLRGQLLMGVAGHQHKWAPALWTFIQWKVVEDGYVQSGFWH